MKRNVCDCNYVIRMQFGACAEPEFYDDQVFMREQVSLPAKMFPKMNGGASRIVALAQQHGLLLGEAEERISMGAASREAAETLGIVQGSPVIVLDRVVHTIHRRPAEWRVGQCRLAGNYYLAGMGSRRTTWITKPTGTSSPPAIKASLLTVTGKQLIPR